MSAGAAVFTVGVIVWLAVACLVLGLCHAADVGDDQLAGWDEWDELPLPTRIDAFSHREVDDAA